LVDFDEVGKIFERKIWSYVEKFRFGKRKIEVELNNLKCY
jgi:hypothetical protein